MGLHHYMTEVRKGFLAGGESGMFFISPSIHNTLEKIKKQLHSVEPRLESLRQLRASAITKWLKLYNLRQVQHLAGHKWISSTEGYLQDEMEGLQEEINKFHPLG
jgi:integrase/recombinase XerD